MENNSFSVYVPPVHYTGCSQEEFLSSGTEKHREACGPKSESLLCRFASCLTHANTSFLDAR